MLFLINFTIEYPSNMTQNELFKIWSEEADVALSAKKDRVVIDLWKVVGERKIICIVNVDSLDVVDQILFDLPIMKKHGQHVNVEVKALRRYEDFSSDINSRIM